MIRSFRGSDTETLFSRGHSLKFQGIERTAGRKLIMLNNARSLDDLRAVPGNRLEELHGDRQGQHSIRINDQWRVCFVWSERDRDAYEVEIVDYH